MEDQNPPELVVVGIGASAGGLQALQQFFTHMPADSGMAFVVILHLSPEYESRLGELLQHSTSMPVTQVHDPVPLAPNQVYVIPPTKHLSMQDSTLQLSEPERPRGRRVAIDLFFRTLAETHDGNAVAVILSGTGSDGTIGLKRVKERGGVTLVQDPAQAEYNEMSRSAIATGLVDFVLPVEQIPQQILTYQQNAQRLQLPQEAELGRPSDADALREIFAILRVRTGHDFSDYKQGTMLRRIGRRMQVRSVTNLPAYINELREHPGEVQALLNDLLISVTNFFRDAEAFAALEAAIPHLFEGKTLGDRVRVWVTACATGEEVYSVAMLLHEYATRLANPPEIQIFATDIDEDAISIAREGVYSENIAGDVSPERLRAFFIKEQRLYRIKKELRDTVLFAVHNLLRDPPFSRLDLVTCRNLLIYLDRNVQEQILALFHFVLRPDGLLLLGGSEFADSVPNLFAPVNKKQRLFSRRTIARTTAVLPTLPLYGPERKKAQVLVPEPEDTQKILSFGELHQKLLEQYAPPSVLVNEAYDIVHLSDHVGRFMQFAGGEPSYNLLKVVHPDLQLELRTALFRATQKHVASDSRHLPVQIDGTTRLVNLIVRPVQDADSTQGFVLVIFDEVGEAIGKGDGVDPNGQLTLAEDEPMVRQLDEELQRTREQLRSTVEQFEISTEELKASNEELQSINEELRSTTEELETGKEELQSINEELTTVNQELKTKVDEISRVNTDLQNFLVATDIATLFLDRSLRIMRYTPRAQELFNLIPSDLNRPLAHVTHQLTYDAIIDDAEQVVDRLVTIEHAVQRRDGRWYLARLLPYRTLEDRIDGVVLTFVDITERKRNEENLEQSRQRIENILESISDAYASVDSAWHWVYMNRAEEQLLHVRRQDLLRKDIRQTLANTDVSRYFDQFQRAMDERVVVAFEGYYPSLATWVEVRIFPADDGGITIYQRDITEQKQAEQRLQASEELLSLLNRNLHDYAIIIMDLQGNILEWNVGAERVFGYSADEIVGQDVKRIYVPEDVAAGVPQQELDTAAATGSADDERWHIRKDGTRFWISGVITTLRDETGGLRGFAKVARDMTEHMQAEVELLQARNQLEQRVQERTQELANANEQLRGEVVQRQQLEKIRQDLMRELVTTQEDERKRISRELHDQMGQQLTAMLLGLESLKADSHGRLRTLEVVEQLQNIANAIGQEVHQLALTLRPTALDDLGLVVVLANYADDWARRTLIDVAFHSNGLIGMRLPPEIETTIYRVVLEALNNVLKHAQATNVSLILERHENEARAIVEDNGQGFDAEALLNAPEAVGRLGLLGMQERVALVGGTLTVESTLGSGTTLFVRIPISTNV